MSITEAEFAALTDEQLNDYLPAEGGDSGDQTDKSEITSTFYRDFQRTFWYSMIPKKMSSSGSDDTISYRVDNGNHFLTYSTFRPILPNIKVKKGCEGKCRIAWCPNVITNMIKHGVFKVDSITVINSLNNYSLDDYVQWGTGSFQSTVMKQIGNIPRLQQWTTILKFFRTSFILPFYYAFSPVHAFPIHYLSSQTVVTHEFVLERKVLNLLRMQVSEDGSTWKDVPPNARLIEGPSDIRFPELWGNYSNVGSQELGFYKDGKEEFETERIFPITDMSYCKQKNPTKSGGTAELELNCDSPTLALFWKAENQRAKNLNCHSNYTSNHLSIEEGLPPTSHHILAYRGKEKFSLGSDQVQGTQAQAHFHSAPCIEGYFAYALGMNPYRADTEVGVVFKESMQAKLSCKIDTEQKYESQESESEDTRVDADDIISQLIGKKESVASGSMEEDDDIEASSSEKSIEMTPFVVHAILLITRKLCFFKKKEDEFYKIKMV